MKITDTKIEPESRWRASNQSHKRRRQNLSQRVLDHYGHECGCCGTTAGVSVWPTDLSVGKVDLVREDGGRPYRSGAFNAWLVRKGLPDGFKPWCTPCVTRMRGPYGCGPEAHSEAGGKA